MALTRVEFNKPLWRYLYQPLYDKVLRFALLSGESESDIVQRFMRLIAGDSTLYLLVDLDDKDVSKIKSHCLVTIINNATIAFVEYMEAESKSTFAQDCLDYIEYEVRNLFPNINKIAFSTTRSDKAFERKYNFTVHKVIMTRDIKMHTNIEENI